MIREAQLFVMAEQMLVEVIGRVRPGDGKIVLPPLFDTPGEDKPLPIRQSVVRYARDDAWVPDLLAGATIDDRFDGDLLGIEPHAASARIAEAACAAAEKVTDGEAPVHAACGHVSTSDYLWRTTMARSFLAHHIAMYLGSRACPLPEELAKGLWEGTQPDAEAWRTLGVFRDPLEPVPADVSWRDRFLMSAGRDPHAIDH